MDAQDRTLIPTNISELDQKITLNTEGVHGDKTAFDKRVVPSVDLNLEQVVMEEAKQKKKFDEDW